MGRDLKLLVPQEPKGNWGRTILFVQRNYKLFDDLMEYSEAEGKIVTETLDLELPLYFGEEIYENSYSEPITAIKASLLLQKMKKHGQERYGDAAVMAYLDKMADNHYVYLNFV